MTVAELIAKLQAMNPAAQVRLEAYWDDGMTGSGTLAHVEYDDDGAVLLRDAYSDAEPRTLPPPITVETDGVEASWVELREVLSPATGAPIRPGDPGPAEIVIHVDTRYFPPGETRTVKLTGRDGRTWSAPCAGEDAGDGLTRIAFPMPPFSSLAEDQAGEILKETP